MRQHDRDFSEFFHAAWPRLYRTALGVAGDPGLAEDALQAAFARPTPRGGGSWSSTLRPTRSGDYPEYTVFDCEVPSGDCVEVGPLTPTGGDPQFIGNDM